MDLRPALCILGLLLLTLAGGMAVPALADAATGNADWQVFAACAGLAGFCGGALAIANAGSGLTLSIRQAFLLVPLAWATVAAFGALPFALSSLALSPMDALFESTSGITTTGATVITNLDQAPSGILVWRALLQWLGGIGFVLTAVALFPFLNVGGMQMFRSNLGQSEGTMPRAGSLLLSLVVVYAALTAACALGYAVLGGMGGFDAALHAMTTVSTGGFSTSSASLSAWGNLGTQAVAVLFMLAGSLPLLLLLKAARGQPGALISDPQVRAFLATALFCSLALAIWCVFHEGASLPNALRTAVFHTVSVFSGTGFAVEAAGPWGPFPAALFFFLMALGGCAGSTVSGAKVFRLQILTAVARAQARRLLHPHGVFHPHYGHRVVPPDVPAAVMGFLFLYAGTFLALALGLSFLGLDFVTAASGALASVSGSGVGLGPVIGLGGSFAPLPEAAKGLLTVGMILGRLEVLPVLVLFAPPFWRR